MRYVEMPPELLKNEYRHCLASYRQCQSWGLSINMARGKPSPEQLALSHGLLTCLSPGDCLAEDGADCRNYGGIDGLPEMKRLFAEMLDVSPGDVIVGGNSSLNMMFDCIATFMYTLWQKPLKFICPVPGYDRHFAICEYGGIEMLPVTMTPEGPDMDAAERAAADPSVAGMWCVPVFSNPQGVVYSNETIRRLARMTAANPHFRLMWDNAYTVHHFRGERPRPLNILQECKQYGCPDRPILFTSFSKISFGGAAVSAMAASPHNRKYLLDRIAVQTVGPDKINQLRHARFFKNLAGVLAHMEKHAAILRPKFELADDILTGRLAAAGAGEWYCPNGGYFISFNTLPGCARRTAALCREAGLITTGAGATYPGRNDPQDSNIRIAPSYLPLEDLRKALEIFCVSVRLAALENLLGMGDG